MERGSVSGSGSYSNANGAMMEKSMAMDSSTRSSSGVATPSAQGGAGDYSKTNVQVEGVDEADFVKNDDRYIYMISGNKLVIVDAYDAKNAKIISSTKLDNDSYNYNYYGSTSREIFINGNRLALFLERSEKAYYFEKYDIMPQQTYRQKTYIYLYDISDKANPKVINTYSVSGSYYESRMKDGIIYLVSQDYLNYNYIEPPMIKDLKTTIIAPDIYYFDNPDENYQLNTITSLDINNDKVVDVKSFLLGYSNTLMVSENNIYIAYQKHQRWCWSWRCYGGSDKYESERFYNVVVPLLEGDLKTQIDAILAKDLNENEKWQQVSDKLSEVFVAAEDNDTLKSQYEGMFTKIQDALQEYDTKKAMEDSKTVIQKIKIDNGKMDYVGEGEVDGALLNQFSMDEFNGNLRVATTVNIWLQKSVEFNNVYVLGEDMSVIGKLENLAKDEKIYSTRFIEDKLYMDTFRQVDPFFVIDLSDATAPKVLGYLKIPGYSDYLHPYDATHVIGIGKNTTVNDYNAVQTTGIKIALFDVSDMENPKEVDSVVIGQSGSDSAALHDHKAFLFSKTKNLLVIPVTEVTSRDKNGMYDYSYKTWNGAYVFNVSTSGFTQLGKVQHSSSTSSYFDWWNAATVQRSLYMDNNLYTISSKYLKINDLGSNLTEIKTITLPYEENTPWWGNMVE
jgi:uncharacterized secreted protein with C-terminal beta-propeller domain